MCPHQGQTPGRVREARHIIGEIDPETRLGRRVEVSGSSPFRGCGIVNMIVHLLLRGDPSDGWRALARFAGSAGSAPREPASPRCDDRGEVVLHQAAETRADHLQDTDREEEPRLGLGIPI